MCHGKIIMAICAAAAVAAASPPALAKGPGAKVDKGQAAFASSRFENKTGFSGSTPPGWSQGKKKGWHCAVGTANCKPPGLRR